MHRTWTIAFASCWLVGCATQPANEIVVPFDYRGGQIIVTASLGSDADHHFLLDTGVNPSVIHLPVAERLSFDIDRSIVGEADGAGDGEGLEIMPTAISNLSMGNQTFANIEAVTADMSPFAVALRMDELSGILGYSFLNARVVRIDYPARNISISASQAHLAPCQTDTKTRVVMPLEFLAEDDPIPLVPIVINGDPVIVTIDTGSSGAIELFPQTVEQLRLESLRTQATTSEAVGARGKRTLQKANIDGVMLADTLLNDVELRFSARGSEETKRGGNAGNKLFETFVVTFDYVEMELILER